MSHRVRWGMVLAALVIGSGLACAATSGREREILRKTAASYRALKSYVLSGTIHVDLAAGERTQTMNAPVVLAGAAPGRLRDEIRHDRLGTLVVANGTRQWQYTAQLGHYTTAAVDEPTADTVAVASPLSANILASYRALASDVKTAKLLRDETLTTEDGPRPCWVVEVDYEREPANAGTLELPKTYWIDQQRHVVLRHKVGIRTAARGEHGGAVQTETITFDRVALNAGAPDSLFAFQPPAGAKAVESFRPETSRGHADLSGQEAFDFTLADLSGKKHTLRDQRGQVVMLDFWATWCGPCRMQMPNVDKLHKEFAGKGLVVYAINEQESADKARRYLDRYKYSTTTLLDSDGEVGNRYKVTGIPSLVVIDREGKIAAHLVGLHSEADLRSALRKGGLAMNDPTDAPAGSGRR